MKVQTEETIVHRIELMDEEQFDVEKRRTGKRFRIHGVRATKRGDLHWKLELLGLNVLKSGETGAIGIIIDRYNFDFAVEKSPDQQLFGACSHQVQQRLRALGVVIRG